MLPMTTPQILKPGLLTPPPPLESAIHALGYLILILGHILPASIARATAWFSAPLHLSPRPLLLKLQMKLPMGGA